MGGFFAQCVERYCELAELDVSSLKDNEFTDRGALASHAAKIRMKAPYGARLLRCDLLGSVCTLAREGTRWTNACDRRLHRLISY